MVVPSPCPRCIFRGREVAESHVRSTLVIIAAPGFDDCAGVGQVVKPVQVEAFIAQRSIEAFDEGIVGGLPRREKSMRTP